MILNKNNFIKILVECQGKFEFYKVKRLVSAEELNIFSEYKLLKEQDSFVDLDVFCKILCDWLIKVEQGNLSKDKSDSTYLITEKSLNIVGPITSNGSIYWIVTNPFHSLN